LAALSMRGRDAAAFVKAFSGSHRFVLDYLLEEVLAGQPAGIREFLVQTSILERMTASLCDAVTGREDSRSMLQRLEQADLFLVPLDDECVWYRYHHLFADLLRRQMNDADPGRVPVLHRRASAWYAAQGLTAEAVDHALAAGDMERAAGLVERSARDVIYASEHATLLRWLEALPVEVVCARPWLCIYLAWSRLWIGPRDQVADWVEAAERALACGPAADLAEDERRRIAGNIYALRAHQAYGHVDLAGVIAMARQAVDWLPAGDTAVGSSMLIAGDAYCWLGEATAGQHAYREAGRIALESGNHSLEVMAACRASDVLARQARLHEAFEASREALQLATLPSGRQLLSAGFPKLQMSQLLCEWNRLEEAGACLQEGMEQCARWGPVGMRFGSWLAQANLQLARGDTGGAFVSLQELDRLLREQSFPFALVPAVDAVRVRVWLMMGRLDEAARWLEENRAGLEGGPGLRYLPGRVNLARVLYALGARDRTAPYLDQALRLVDLLLPEASAAGWIHDVIRLLVRKALALHARDDVEKALATLAEALGPAGPGGYVRTFIDDGEPMGQLLRLAAARGIAPHEAYVERLLAELEPEGRTAGAPPAEALSARELEILRQLATGLSTSEIAGRLFISIGTLRVHMKSIYRKLRAHRRSEAVRRAREIGALPWSGLQID
jgi:LuxR family maltose regulon positive regulatory protein